MQLIKITSIPIQIEQNTQPGGLQMKYYHPQMNVTRVKNGLSIQSVPSKMQINNDNFKSSIGLRNNTMLSHELKSISRRAVLESIARIASEGNMLVDGGKEAIADIYLQRAMSNNNVNIEVGYVESSDISWTDSELNIDYTPDQLNISFNIRKPDIDFIPTKVSFEVKRWNQVIIEYLGEINYFPPSKSQVV